MKKKEDNEKVLKLLNSQNKLQKGIFYHLISIAHVKSELTKANNQISEKSLIIKEK